MKKGIAIIICFLCLIVNTSHIKAYSDEYTEALAPYIQEINQINENYNCSYYILNEREYLSSDLQEVYGNSYKGYVNHITSQDIETFKKDLIIQSKWINDNATIDIKLDNILRSTSGSKTVSFFNGYNRMTLKYKYNGSKFDTSYNPTVSVSKVSVTMYFEMQSHSGKFTNSNKTYSVTALGRIITTTGIANDKSFTVNFNL